MIRKFVPRFSELGYEKVYPVSAVLQERRHTPAARFQLAQPRPTGPGDGNFKREQKGRYAT